MLTKVSLCSKLQHNTFETIEEVLQYYPRLHKDCQLQMQDGEYATLVGTVTKNKTVNRVSMTIMILEFTVQPNFLAELRAEDYAPSMRSDTTSVNVFWHVMLLRNC